MKDTYWDSDLFVSERYENWHKDMGKEKVKAKLDRILRDNYPPEPVISAEKVKKLEEILRRHLNDDLFVDRFLGDIEAIIGRSFR